MCFSFNRNKHTSQGFTIVELLIVVVVIAILAAITIVAYNGIQNRAKASAAQSAAKQAFTKIQSYAVENAESYPTQSQLDSIGISNTGETTYQYSVNNSSSPRTFCITATSQRVSYYLSNSSSSPVVGACAGHGANGETVITNLVANPSAEVDTAGIVPNVAIVSRSTAWGQNGSASFMITPNSTSSNDSYITVGGDQFGGFRTGFEAGKTYTISGTVRLDASLTGSIRAQSRKIVAYYKNSAGTPVGTESTQAANTPGSTRLSVVLAIPATATEAWVRFYNGTLSGGGNVWWDSLMITEGSELLTYADGTSGGWAWTGTPNNSTSTGPRL